MGLSAILAARDLNSGGSSGGGGAAGKSSMLKPYETAPIGAMGTSSEKHGDSWKELSIGQELQF